MNGDENVLRKIQREWLTVSEVAELIEHHDTQAVYRWIRQGLLPARDLRRAGKKKPCYRVSREEAEKLNAKLRSGLTVGA